MTPDDPHREQPVFTAGAPLERAAAVVVLAHGRGGSAQDMLGLSREFAHPAVAYFAPQAFGHTWYPYGFMSPMEQNEPFLSSALAKLGAVVQQVVDAGVPHEKIMLLGFSQGACLSSEFIARNARRYGGLAALTGGLIGPDGTPRDYSGRFDGMSVFLGSSDPDPHIPVSRVDETEQVLQRMGAEVTKRIYPGMPHTVNREELEYVARMQEALLDQ